MRDAGPHRRPVGRQILAVALSRSMRIRRSVAAVSRPVIGGLQYAGQVRASIESLIYSVYRKKPVPSFSLSMA